jgi:hypothetical protein
MIMTAWYRFGALLCITGVVAGCGDNDNGAGPGATPTATPVPTATAPPQIPCPAQVTYTVQGDGSDFDSGWTGIYFDQELGTGGSLTFAVDCPGDFLGACGTCPISGPIASTTVVDNRRCRDASEVTCTSDADCPGSACVFFFGAPVPVSGGGFPVCVTNEVTNAVTGTIVPEIGSGDSNLDLLLSIYTGLAVDQPCPICDGAGFDAAGTCQGGARDGQACTVHGTTAVFGNTSFDCPPNAAARIGTTEVPLDPTTGTRTLDATVPCTGGAPLCYCLGQSEANACLDGVCTAEADGEGSCLAGPFDLLCEGEPFRGCFADSDCPAAGDRCVSVTRKCSGETDGAGMLTGPLARTGAPSTTLPLQVSTFCVDATSSEAINQAAGLPGPATVRMPTAVCIFPSCPP